MDTVARYVRLYGLMVGQYMKVRLQYRFDFFVSLFGMFLVNVSAVLGLRVVLASIPALAGWKYEELVFIYGFSLLAQSPLQIAFDHIWSLRFHVNEGTFIRFYFKPVPTLFGYMAEMVDLKGFGQLAFGIGATAWAAGALGIEWTASRVVLFPVLLAGSSLVLVALMLLAASASFWVKDSFAILNFMNGFRDHARYPIAIYDAFFRALFTWVVPIGFIAFYPSQAFLMDAAVPWTAYAAPAFGIALYWLAVKVWDAGVAAWGGTGS